jgi:hypothetical protein
MFRSRLYHLKNEEELQTYFAEWARRDDKRDIYTCAGCISDTPRGLYLKLHKEWIKDKEYYETVELPTLAKDLLMK